VAGQDVGRFSHFTMKVDLAGARSRRHPPGWEDSGLAETQPGGGGPESQLADRGPSQCRGTALAQIAGLHWRLRAP